MSGRSAIRHPARPALLLAMALALGACADFDGLTDPTGGLPDVAVVSPTFTRHIQPMLEKRCAIGGCHSVATHRAGLALVGSAGYDALVGRPSAFGEGELLVEPGRPDRSWLVAVVGPDAERRHGFPRMPLASQPLTPNQIATIVNWIANGAPRD